MDWAKQTEEMMKNWTETQKTMWDSWLEAINQSGAQNQAAELWQKTVETWEKSVKNTLEAQTEWTKVWAENVQSMNTPQELTEWAKQAQEMTKQWSDTQQQMWQGWFELVKTADPGKMADAWGDEGKKAFQAWQKSTQKIMDTQMNWASSWTEQAKSKTANKK